MDDAIRSFERLKEMHPKRTFYLESREVDDAQRSLHGLCARDHPLLPEHREG